MSEALGNNAGLVNLKNYCDVDKLDSGTDEKKDSAFKDRFCELLSVEQKTFLQKSFDKSYIFIYFNNYLQNETSGVRITTVVTEKDYTCSNYLDDYANYYARCYTPYKKKCKRLHFFSGTSFDLEEFKKMIMDDNHDNWKNYQGCIVVKPIPKGVFGVTYLNHYDINENINPIPQKNAKGRLRYYKCLTDQVINIFGVNKIVKTMPFKEQDGVVASCATTAMWMAFHKTAELFQTKAPSLSEITILAGDNENNSGKIFPSKGLRVSQVCKAINNLGMVAEIKTQFDSRSYFNAFVHAYLQGDIPVLFGFNMKTPDRDTPHLVTLNGYRYDNKQFGLAHNHYISDTIEKFYAHDDQIGPYTRIQVKEILGAYKPEFTQDSDSYDHDRDRKTNEHLDVTTAWWCDMEKAVKSMKGGDDFKNNLENYRHARPDYLIVPLSSAIKVSFDDIYSKLLYIRFIATSYIGLSFLDAAADNTRNSTKSEMIGESVVKGGDKTSVRKGFTWNILITKNNNYKSWLHSYFNNFGQKKLLENVDIMMLSLPKYIWVIQAYEEDNLLFDFVFDTVENNMYGLPICVNIYRKEIETVLKSWRDTRIFNSFTANPESYNSSLLKELIEDIKITPPLRSQWHDILKEMETKIEGENQEINDKKRSEYSDFKEILKEILKKPLKEDGSIPMGDNQHVNIPYTPDDYEPSIPTKKEFRADQSE
jgi:hypothetical protein